MNKFWKTLKSIFAVLLVLTVTFGAGYFVGSIPEEEPEVVEDSDDNFDVKLPGEKEKRVVTKEEIELVLVEISQFSTYSGEYTVSKAAEYSRYFIDDIPIPGTTNEINIECDGIVKVGYDVYDIVPTVDNESQKIYISLPTAKVLDNYVIWDTVKCEETNNILNPIDFEQYQVLIGELEALGLEKAETEGIYQAAEDNIKVIIKNFLSGFEEFEIVFM